MYRKKTYFCTFKIIKFCKRQIKSCVTNPIVMKKMRSSLKREFEKIEAEMAAINELYYAANGNEITKERLFDYLLLHPIGYINESNSNIMNSAIAEKYFRMGYITKGVDSDFVQQYRLTSFGLSQIELATSLSLLS